MFIIKLLQALDTLVICCNTDKDDSSSGLITILNLFII